MAKVFEDFITKYNFWEKLPQGKKLKKFQIK